MSTSAAVTATFAPAGTALNIDIDSNKYYLPQSDGILIVRYLFGFRGDALTDHALALNATLTDSILIAQRLDNLRPLLDVDGNGQADALTDGLLILRYLLGLSGDALTTGAIGLGAARTSFSDVELYLVSVTPVLP